MKDRVSCGMCGGNAPLIKMTVPKVIGDQLLLIHDVPCYKCTQCGEIFYDISVAETLRKIAKAYQGISEKTEIGYAA